ncbi:MAG: DUF262 and DUF1524 domain-containing protein [Oscillospiraceae bacterium]|nr:DUF262 and DUF1524 domain-containing protein [Oscillospiraceae bacterium]
MEAIKSNVYQILDGKKQFVIPVYQRMYSWEKDQCERLWIDIIAMQKTGREGHFVGSIVNIGEKVQPTGVQKFMIIDGQQRLTTLTLLLIALRDYIKSHSDVVDVNAQEITDTLLINMYASGDDRYKMYLTQNDRNALIKLIEHSPIEDGIKSRLLENYDFFTQQVKKNVLSPIEVYQSIGKLQIVNITLDRGTDDPQAIFESLNSTGMDLKDSDLIRNHILMGLDADTQIDVYRNIWRPTELLFDYEHQSEIMDNFFRDYLTMKLGRIPRKNEVYKEFKSYHNTNYEIPIRDLCDDIYRFAKYYANMYFCRNNDADLKLLYEDMKEIRMEVAYPFLLKIHDDCNNGLITIEDLKEIVKFCISYILRRAVCDIPTNSLNKTFATMKNDIRLNDYLNSVKASFILLDSYKEFPTDERFIASFISRDIYSMNRCRYIIEQLENWNNKSVVSAKNLTIEHIIPQNPNLSDNWKAALGEKWNEIQKKYLHTIGNLTLTAYNAEMSDLSFEEKLNMDGGFKQSALRINKYVVMQSIWGEEQVKERAEKLSEIAKHVWPYPTLTESELSAYRKLGDSVPQYSLESYDQMNDYNRILFEKLNIRILNLGTFVRRDFKKLYISYKADAIFVSIIILNKGLKIFACMDYSNVIDPKGITKDVTGVGHHGIGNVEMFFDNLDNIDDIMTIIEQAFQLQDIV